MGWQGHCRQPGRGSPRLFPEVGHGDAAQDTLGVHMALQADGDRARRVPGGVILPRRNTQGPWHGAVPAGAELRVEHVAPNDSFRLQSQVMEAARGI